MYHTGNLNCYLSERGEKGGEGRKEIKDKDKHKARKKHSSDFNGFFTLVYYKLSAGRFPYQYSVPWQARL